MLNCEWHPHSLPGTGHQHQQTLSSAFPRATGKLELQLKSCGDKKQFAHLSVHPGCTKARCFPMTMEQGLQRGRPDPAAWFTHTHRIYKFVDTLKLSSAKLSAGVQDLIFFSASFLLPLKQESLCFILLHRASIFSS